MNFRSTSSVAFPFTPPTKDIVFPQTSSKPSQKIWRPPKKTLSMNKLLHSNNSRRPATKCGLSSFAKKVEADAAGNTQKNTPTNSSSMLPNFILDTSEVFKIRRGRNKKYSQGDISSSFAKNSTFMPTKALVLDSTKDSALEPDSLITTPGKIFQKYAEQGKDMHGNVDSIGNLFENLFNDLSKAFPHSADSLGLLENLARSLQTSSSLRLPSEHLNGPNHCAVRHKVIEKNSKLFQATSISRAMKRTCSKYKKPNPTISATQFPFKMVENAKKLNVGNMEATRKPKKRQLSMNVPKLNLELINNTREYNEEFLDKFEYFSESWKRECKDMKTVDLCSQYQ
eukprot:TRINITY_DN123936_c0_g1_i1.p1 TRINITY_DN123936_c0_g1~~TRINITY_DN123936_c0_g1_i1.p1  ORF type:complete len:341 (+),score=18.02 TRINITY_DN123936_c0_g1_i1:233-1255(+)